MKIEHIIFDCDGVLLDTEIVAAEVMSEWLQANGVGISIETFIRAHTGKTFSGIIRELQATNELSPELDIRAGVHTIETKVKSNIRLVEGIREALPKIDLPKSVVSNSSIGYIENALSKFEIQHHFDDRLFSSEQVAAPKPSPLVYELAVEHVGVSKEDILVIEDSLTGVQAAIEAGLKVWGFLGGSHIIPGHDNLLLNIGATDVINNYDQLIERFKDLGHTR